MAQLATDVGEFPRLAAIGLGNLGVAIAARLHECGVDVLGVDLSEERRSEWRRSTGVQAASSLDEVDWEAVDVVLVQVRLTEQARDVIRRVAGLRVKPGLAFFVITTLEIGAAKDLGALVDERFRLIEMPVSGADVRARSGELSLLAAGELTDSEEKFLLSTIGSRLVRFPEYGEPTAAKLINNLVAAYNARTLTVVLELSNRLGLAPSAAFDIILTSSGSSFVATIYRDLFDEVLVKDVGLIRDHLGKLPAVSLDSDEDFRAQLEAVRATLDDSTGGR